MYKRPVHKILLQRLQEPKKFIQVVMGPRQVGKTTLVRQVLEDANIPFHFAAADAVPASSGSWLEQQWQIGRIKAKQVPVVFKQECSSVLANNSEISRVPDHSFSTGR